jgi:beta-glucosidase-like glycosyl hydrolase
MMQALRDAIHSGRITMARIDQSVRRIVVLKMRMGLIPVPLTLTIPVPPLGSMTTMDGPTSAVRLAG